jgi:cytochrome c556
VVANFSARSIVGVTANSERIMMNKIVRGTLVAAAAVLAITAFNAGQSVFAQDAKTAISMRQSAMKGFGGHYKAISGFLKEGMGSAEDVAKRAGEMSATAKMLPSYFPAKSGMDMVTDPKTRADAMIWTDMAKFESFAALLAAEADKLATVAKTGDKEAIQAQLGVIGKNACGACHGTFRGKSS